MLNKYIFNMKRIVILIYMYTYTRKMQELDGLKARRVDCFDVISEISTRGLVIIMLTGLGRNNQLLFIAKDMKPFYF